MKRHSTGIARLLAAGVMTGAMLSVGFVAPASAQTPPQESVQQDPSSRDEVVITSGAMKKAARAFVDAIAAAPRGDNTMARWDRRICPGVTGFVPDYAQRILDQITRRAHEVGLDVGEPGCKANILILVTLEPNGVAQDLFDTYRDALGQFNTSGQRTMGRDEMKKFLQSDAPVRWWHVSEVKGRDGAAIAGSGAGGSQKPTLTLHDGSARLSSTTRQDFASAIIIVDAARLDGVTLGAFADYLAMVGLAQIDSDADTADLSTILNLYAGRSPDDEPLKGMTEWDVAYLKGLYDARRDARSVGAQEGDIARTVASELSGQ